MTHSISIDSHDHNLTGLVYWAERYFNSLVGSRLAQVASWAAYLAELHSAELLACDRQGERIVGAATVQSELRAVDTTRRLDGQRIVLVAGALAGPVSLEQSTMILRSLGASEVHCAWADGWSGEIGAADSSTRFCESQGSDLSFQLLDPWMRHPR